MKKIYVSDYTLKHLAESRKNPLLFREKVAVATAVDNMGVDMIELNPVSNFKEDRIICNTISKAVKNSAVAIPVGVTPRDVEQAWECICTAQKPILQVVLPLSTVQMEYIYHFKAPKMMELIETLVKAAKQLCENVEFIACDASRAEETVLMQAIKIAVDCGATAVTLDDDAGTLFPIEFAEFVSRVKSQISVPLYVKVSGMFYMETSTAFESVIRGADGVKSVTEGSQHLKTHRFAKVIAAKGEAYGICTDIDLTRIHSDVDTLSNLIAETEKETDTKSVSGDVFLSSDASIKDVSDAAEKLGYTLTEADASSVLRGIVRVCERKGSIGTKEFEALIASYAMQAPSTYHLESYTVTSSNLTTAMAHVVLRKTDGRTIAGTGIGEGPIDAAFSAIEQGLGCHYELDDFQINTVTEGKESLGSALVKLLSNGKIYSGTGISADTVDACIRAYINALNKIVYEEI